MLKNQLLLLFTLCLVLSLSSQGQNNAFYIPATQLNVDGLNMGVQPGDTVFLEAGQKRFLRIVNFHGNADHPIIFMNYGGEVIVQNDDWHYAIKIGWCSFFRFTGSGVEGTKYGIRILETKPGGVNGLSVDDFSTNFEVDHIEIANVGFAGIMSKTNPSCDSITHRDNFTQYSSVFHNNYIHDTGGEGMYIGHTYYNGYNINCNGEPTVVLPSVLKGVRIYDNIIENTGYDGIQVSSAVEDCEIYNNVVLNYGITGTWGQIAGIQLGGGTTGKCYNNFIADGKGIGITVFGLGDIDIFNNVVVNAGRNHQPEDSTVRVHGMFCEDRNTIPGSSFNFYNNTIVNPKTDGIRFSSTESAENKFYNNIIVGPGSINAYSPFSKESPFINIGGKNGIDAIISNNYFHANMSQVQFVDSLEYNFRLNINSPCIDDGIDLTNSGVVFDFDQNSRPSGSGFDIGAFEYQVQSSSSWQGERESEDSQLDADNTFFVYPNPTTGIFYIHSEIPEKANLYITNKQGEIVFRKNNFSDWDLPLQQGKQHQKGFYYVILRRDSKTLTKTLVIE